MQDFLYNLTSGDYATMLSWQSVLEVVISASIIGFVISLVYMLTHKK